MAVGALERFAADFERETEQVTLPARAPKTGLRIAVVGSGPAGLIMAADMAVKGHSVTIFEALHSPGGVLVYGIPEFRLPKAIVQAETGDLRHLGVKFELNSIVGKLYGLTELFDLGSTPSTWRPGPACLASWVCPGRTSATSSRPTSTSPASIS